LQGNGSLKWKDYPITNSLDDVKLDNTCQVERYHQVDKTPAELVNNVAHPRNGSSSTPKVLLEDKSKRNLQSQTDFHAFTLPLAGYGLT